MKRVAFLTVLTANVYAGDMEWNLETAERAHSAYVDCAVAAVEEYKTADDEPHALAIAALGTCTSERHAFVRALDESGIFEDYRAAERYAYRQDDKLIPILIQRVVSHRSRK